MVYYFSCCCVTALEKGEIVIYFVSQFEGRRYRRHIAMNCLLLYKVRKQREMNAGAQTGFSFFNFLFTLNLSTRDSINNIRRT